ncbi:hypothetical protein CEXT_533091 [Caerostris extrusa]|uniref:Uncharacterized protein n=1 Tax=Caerostris extrusa TaxID=172846 RepID=A0AAV4MSV0_CAEEX|nr:hypothetical protein CEXT_533091 [Caerostris extrusa]
MRRQIHAKSSSKSVVLKQRTIFPLPQAKAGTNQVVFIGGICRGKTGVLFFRLQKKKSLGVQDNWRSRCQTATYHFFRIKCIVNVVDGRPSERLQEEQKKAC